MQLPWGYAWDVIRRDDAVRDSINGWLGSSKLKTPYQLVVRSLAALDQMQAVLEEGLEKIDLDMEPDYDGKSPDPVGAYPVIKDIEVEAGRLFARIDSSDIDRVRDLVLIDLRTNTVVTHRDVGIGISQVLPVLVTAYASKEKLLAMEQPEIHLHPALQAELADVFIESALGKRGNTFVLETHSEHLVLRLLRRIRETSEKSLPEGMLPIRPEDVCIVYVQPGQKGASVVEIPVTAEGDFAGSWPDGFFAERAKELF